MAFYDLSKEERAKLVARIQAVMCEELSQGLHSNTLYYFSDEDTYIRKSAYL